MYTPTNIEDFISILIQEQDLTEEQKKILREEITNDPEGMDYSGTDQEVLRTLCFGYYRTVTTPATTLSNGYVDMGSLRVLLTREKAPNGAPYIVILKLLAESTDQATQILGITINEVLNWEAINTADQDVIDQFTLLNTLGILPEDLVNEILYHEVAESTEQIYQTPRYLAIGLSGVPSLSEILECRS